MIPLDFNEIKMNQSKYSFLINDKGGVIDDLIITRVKGGFNIILNAACKDNDIKEIAKCLIFSRPFLVAKMIAKSKNLIRTKEIL